MKDLIPKIRLKYLTYLKATDSLKLISNMMGFVFLEYHPDCSCGEWNRESLHVDTTQKAAKVIQGKKKKCPRSCGTVIKQIQEIESARLEARLNVEVTEPPRVLLWIQMWTTGTLNK